MQAKRFTRRFPKHAERHLVSSVLLPATRIALALAVASACRAQAVGTWTEFSSALTAGGEVLVTGDIAFETNLRVDAPATVTGEGGAFLDGSLLSSRKPGVYATESLLPSNLGTFTTDDVGFIEDPDALQGGVRHFAGGAVVIEQYAVNKKDMLVTVSDTVFAENGGDTRQQVNGAAFVYRERTQGYAATPIVNRLEIRRSAFYRNTVEGYAGALDVDRVNEVLIQGSTFQENASTVWGGAALFVRTKDIVMEDTSFFGNQAKKGGALYVSYESPWAIGAVLAPPFAADKGPNLPIRAVNRDVVFRENVATSGEGSDIYVAKASSQTPHLNLSAKAGRKIEFNGEIFLENTTENRRDPGNAVRINAEPDDAGEVILNGDIRSRWYSGGWGGTKVAQVGEAHVTLGGGILTLGNPAALSSSRLIVPKGGNPTLNLTAPVPGAAEPVALYEIGFLDAAGQTVDLLVDADLNRGVADTLRFGGFRGYRNFLRVSGWNVLADVPAGTKETVVTLAPDDAGYPQVFFELAPDAEKATGALYVYDVSVANPDEWEASPVSHDGKFRFTVAGEATKPHADEPRDFNPQVYGEALALKAALLQHEISHRLFDTGSSANGHVSGSIEGGTTDLSVSHFDDLDFDYWVALFDAKAPSVRLGDNASGTFGVYGGFVSASTEGRVNDVQSLGVYLGAEANLEAGPVFWKNHANVGYLESDLDVKGGRDAGKTENVWVGVGSSLGFDWRPRGAGLTVRPSLDFVYTFVKGDDFTTGDGVDIEVGDLQGWEVSPGVRLENAVRQNGAWRFYAEARCVWTGDSADVKAVHLRDADGAVPDRSLPGLRYGDFAKALVGLQREEGDWRVTLGIDGKFGLTQGWGAGAALRQRFRRTPRRTVFLPNVTRHFIHVGRNVGRSWKNLEETGVSGGKGAVFRRTGKVRRTAGK